MVNGSYNTINSEIEPNRSFNLDGSSIIITNNLLYTTGSKGQRKEQGTNVTIDIDDYILDESQEAAQAPIKPFLSDGVRSIIFKETFSSDISTLEGITSYYNNGETLTTSNSTFPTDEDHISGSAVLKVGDDSGNDETGLLFDVKIPLDPNKLYEFEIRVKGDAGNSGTIYAGAQGYKDNGDYVNAAGSNLNYSQHNFLYTGGGLTDTNWTVVKGYVLGHAVGNGSLVSPDISNPGKFHADVTKFSPYFIFNYTNEAGIMYIDYFTIKEVGRGQYPGYIARKSSTLLGNVVKGRISSRYYRKLTNGKETKY